MRERIRDIIRHTCAEVGVQIVQGVLARDHVHMFISVRPQLALSKVTQMIKDRSLRQVQMAPELRTRYWGRRFAVRTAWHPCQKLACSSHTETPLKSKKALNCTSDISSKVWGRRSAYDQSSFATLSVSLSPAVEAATTYAEIPAGFGNMPNPIRASQYAQFAFNFALILVKKHLLVPKIGKLKEFSHA